VLTDHKSVSINESCGILLYLLKFYGARMCFVTLYLYLRHRSMLQTSHTSPWRR
jgi:hypothetical protein